MSRRHILAVATLAVGTLVATAVADLPTRLVWNVTASAPIGFYTVENADALEVPELVALMPPEPLEQFMVERGYIGRGVPLLKRVLGLPGQRVCRSGATITVDGVEMGDALERDRMGRDLPVWQGCRIIRDGELFLMNWEVQDSLDGRYFGPVPASSVIGRALPLWTDGEGDGRYEWRAGHALNPPLNISQRRLVMPQIGQFTRDETGFAGRVHTLTLYRELTILPTQHSDAENAPDYRVHHGADDGPEIGAAWKRTGEKAGEYLSVLLDDPALSQPIRANLFRDDDAGTSWSLHWTRPRPREDRD